VRSACACRRVFPRETLTPAASTSRSTPRPAAATSTERETGSVSPQPRTPSGSGISEDFGSIPGTRAEDGDALDVLVLHLAPAFPGCLVTVRLIGVLNAEQRERGKLLRNDRLIGVADTPVNPARLGELHELDAETLRAIEHFFTSYNAFQGREFTIRSRGGAGAALQTLERAIEAHGAQSGGDGA